MHRSSQADSAVRTGLQHQHQQRSNNRRRNKQGYWHTEPYQPNSHAVQAPVGEQAVQRLPQLTQALFDVAPEAREYVAFGQLLHVLLAAAVEYVPALQLSQLLQAACEKVPALQFVHDAEPQSEYVPALQLSQLLQPASEYVPGAQSLQL